MSINKVGAILLLSGYFLKICIFLGSCCHPPWQLLQLVIYLAVASTCINMKWSQTLTFIRKYHKASTVDKMASNASVYLGKYYTHPPMHECIASNVHLTIFYAYWNLFFFIVSWGYSKMWEFNLWKYKKWLQRCSFLSIHTWAVKLHSRA